MRVNVGAGRYALPGYYNVDEIDYPGIDLVAHFPPLPFDDDSIEEVWACHMLEHLSRPAAAAFLEDVYRVLIPGGMLGVVVPDTRVIVRHYLDSQHSAMPWEGRYIDVADLDDVCTMFLYSTGQDSPHLWSYDVQTLSRVIQEAGFLLTGEIDRHNDPRLGSGAWYQCGWNALKL